MRTILDKKRVVSAAALIVVATLALAAAWAMRGADFPLPRCNDRGANNEAVLECVAERAVQTSPAPAASTATLVGVSCLVLALFISTRAIRRVITLHDAADELQVPIAQVRQWVTEGALRNHSTDEAYIYLDREQVHRFGSSLSGELAAEGPSAGG